MRGNGRNRKKLSGNRANSESQATSGLARRFAAVSESGR